MTNMAVYTNYRLLILLSMSELITSIFIIIGTGTWVLVKQVIVISISYFFIVLNAGISLSAVYLLTLNHLLCASCAVWYRKSMTRKKFLVTSVLVCGLITGLNLGCSLVLRIFDQRYPTVSTICGVIAQLLHYIYFVFCVGTYIATLVTLFKSRQSTQESNNTTGFMRFVWNAFKDQGYVKPFLITLTFMLFVVIPFVAKMVCVFNGCLLSADSVWMISSVLNHISDVLFYVFCDRDIRLYLKKKFTRRDNNVERNNHSG